MNYTPISEFWALFDILVGVWVMIDASKRGLSGLAAFLWGFATVLVFCVGLPAWLLWRPNVPGSAPFKAAKLLKPLSSSYQETEPGRCPACGGHVNPDDTNCSSCGIHFLQAPTAPPPEV
jgi:hypothetical protein